MQEFLSGDLVARGYTALDSSAGIPTVLLGLNPPRGFRVSAQVWQDVVATARSSSAA